MDEIKDFLGTPIKVGSKIVYAATVGRSARLTLGVVLSVGKPKTEYSMYKVSIKVQPMKDSWGSSRFKEWQYDPVLGKGEHVDRAARPVTLHYTDRLMVLDGSSS